MNKIMKKILTAVCAVTLCIGMSACSPISIESMPRNIEVAEKRMEKAGYDTKILTVEETQELLGMEVPGLEKALLATGEEDEYGYGAFIALYFESEDAAKAFMELLGEADQGMQEGKWVYAGEYKAMDAFEKLF